MSVCMRSAQGIPQRLFASSRTSTTSTAIPSLPKSRVSNSTAKVRWNSSKVGANDGTGVKGKSGWTGFSVLALMGISAVGAGAFARWQGEKNSGKVKDYSSPEKFVQPRYASIQDMEAVSCFWDFSTTFPYDLWSCSKSGV